MTDPQRLPPLEKTDITVGYMRLSDSAPLIMAKELGLYQQNGLEVRLHREVSWANLRDRLVMGELDAAQMLAPLPMMTSFGAGGIRANLLTGLSLSLNGNAITLSHATCKEAAIDVADNVDKPRESALKIAAYLQRTARRQPLTFATVHLFSTHTFLLRTWLKAGGINPDRDVRIIVLPPEQMCDSLARGIIDGFCVGEPWNTMAVQQGIGSVVATGYRIWNNAPEKVLCVTDNWHNQHPGTHARLRVALMQACQALADPAMRQRAAEVLSAEAYLNVPRSCLLPSLTGNYRFHKGGSAHRIENFHVFWDYQACFPWRSHGQMLLQMSADTLGREIGREDACSLIQQCYRTDLYRDAARLMGVASPDNDAKPEDTHDAPWEMAPGIELGADRILGGLE